MSASLEFRIDCSDTASKVVEAVQHKIQKLGKDIGHSIMTVVGPMAILHKGFEVVSNYMEDLKRKREEAFNWGSSLQDNAAKIGLTAEQFERLNAAANMTGMSVDKVGQAFKLAADLIEQGKKGNAEAIAKLEALGISVQDLGNTRPEDVLQKLAGAMSAAESPADKLAISMAALGKAAKDLQDVLSGGFDIKAALEAGGVTELSNEAARYLAEMAKKKRDEEIRAMARSARQQATEAFLNEDPEGRAILNRITQERMRAQGQGAGTGTAIVTAGNLSVQSEVQTQVQAILKARADAEKERKRLEAEAAAGTPQNIVAATNLRNIAFQSDIAALAAEAMDAIQKGKPDKDKADAKVPTPKAAKDIAERASAVTVSSLRSIGGGLSGETATFADVAFQSLAEQKAMNDTLRRIESKLVPPPSSTDFTKNPNIGGDQQFVPGQYNIGPMTAASRVGVA